MTSRKTNEAINTASVKIDKLKANPNNIRKEYDKEYIENLGKSIKKYGILNPILALRNGTIVAGHCRWMACKEIKKKELEENREIIFIDVNEKDTDTINAVENIMRRNINIFEESDGLYNIIRKHLKIETADEIFRHIQNAYTYIHSGGKLTSIQKNILEIIESMGITINRAKTLLAIQDIKEEVRAYIIRRNAGSAGGRGDLSVDKIYQLSFIPPKHQMKVVKAYIHARFSDMRLAYKQWLNGLRDDEFNFKRLNKSREMMAVNAAMERRDKVIANLKESSGTRFTLGAFIMDIHMLQDSIKLAKACREKEGLEITSRARELIFETMEMLKDLSNAFALSQNDTKCDKSKNLNGSRR